MKNCMHCGAEMRDEADICLNCGCRAPATIVIYDEVSIPLCILSAITPLFGLIYWAVQCHVVPAKAKACGITALISMGVSMLLSCLLSGFYASLLTSMLSSI